MAGGLALDPLLAPSAQPVVTPAGGQRPVQRFVVHPGQDEHLSGVVLLGDRGDEPVRVALEPGGDRGVQRGRADGTLRHSWPPLVTPRSYEVAAGRGAGKLAPAPPPRPRRTIAG